MQNTEQKITKMGTNWVWSWIDSYQWLIDGYTTDGWKNGGQWYFIRLKSGHQIYGRDTEDGGSGWFSHEDWVSIDGWDISEAIPELVGEYFVEIDGVNEPHPDFVDVYFAEVED